MIDPSAWPVLVTGAGGFVGGHVARELAGAGHPVRGLVRRPVRPEPGDPPIDWIQGDLRDSAVRARALAGVRAVLHVASWVNLGPDPDGSSRAINVEATRSLLRESAAAGVERFVYTSTVHTLATGTPEAPADESQGWNLQRIESPYCQSKREAEALVLNHDGPGPSCLALCPGMVIGPRDRGPTSTRVLLAFARFPVAILPQGGIPIVDVRVLARAHRNALVAGEPGQRYAVVGAYLSYPEMARLIARLTGWPRWVIPLPDRFHGPLDRLCRLGGRVSLRLRAEVPPAVLGGAFLRLHVSGERANRELGLVHPTPLESFQEALRDARRSGLAPWLKLEPAAETPREPEQHAGRSGNGPACAGGS